MDSFNESESVQSDSDEYDGKRCETLGYKPQKEVGYNKLLHYSDKIDEESTIMLAEIKGYLGTCVIMRELKPGIWTWVFRLRRYIDLYGLKFSKEDHILFIKLIFELLFIPDIEPVSISNFAGALLDLMKKRQYITPEDLVLPWRPLYDLYNRHLNSSRATLGMYRFNPSLVQTLDHLVHLARLYFDKSATQEILDEGRPMLCPFEPTIMWNAINFFEWFLPIALPPDQSNYGYELWLDELMELWNTCHNAQNWEKDIMWLIARLAYFNIGYIDWDKYTPLMFTRFLRSMNLPVHYKQNLVHRGQMMEPTAMSLWIVSTLGGGSSTQKYLDKFMKTVESYFHPANAGHWVVRLKDMLVKLCRHFFQRIQRERYKKLLWEMRVPDEYKLTEEDITAFVESMKPAILNAMFPKGAFGTCLISVGDAMRCLATLRPEIIIPPIIEMMYSSVDSLTEPHKYTAVLHCTSAIARPMVESVDRYPEGRTHVIPLLFASLPGIDPNDIGKCFITLHFIVSFTSAISFVDCSTASEHYSDLTPEEEIVCSATAQLEDFVVQLLDRIFSFIENSSMETTRLEQKADKRNWLESTSETFIASAMTSILNQTSPAIFNVALQKLVTFVKSHLLETKVSGSILATLCCYFGDKNPELTLRLLIPHLTETILTITESSEDDGTVDKELLYNLLILSELASCLGIIPYLPQLEQVLDKTLYTSDKELYEMAGDLLGNIFTSLSSVRPLEYCNSNNGISDDISKSLPIREWGKPGDMNNLNVEWYYPKKKEVKESQRLLSKYLPPELERIDKHIRDEAPLTREDIQRSLNIIIVVLKSEKFLPLWDEPAEKLVDSALDQTCIKITMGFNGEITMPDGSNVRKTVARTIMALQDKILQGAADDTKTLVEIVEVWNWLLLNANESRKEFNASWKEFVTSKKTFGDRLGKKRLQRQRIIERVMLQHLKRLSYRSNLVTETHKEILFRLLALSTSRYSEVRTQAQHKLELAIRHYSYSYFTLVPKLVENLRVDPTENHELFKGTLYVLMGPKAFPLIARHDWKALKDLWPALVKAKLSEKPSVINLLDNIVDVVKRFFTSLSIATEFTEEAAKIAKKLWSTTPTPCLELPSSDEELAAVELLSKRNNENRENYLDVLQSLNDAIVNNNLHWRYHSMALNFQLLLAHQTVPYPPESVRNFLSTLIHDCIFLRKVSFSCIVLALKQQRREHKKVEVALDKLVKAAVSGDDGDAEVKDNTGFGDRLDNFWLQYNSSTVPKSQEEWDEPRFQNKAHVGYYTWPKELMTYAPSSEQPPLDRRRDEMPPEEQPVYDFFMQASNIEKLIKYLSTEEKKGTDKFNALNLALFKSLFWNHGDAFLDLFKPHLDRLVEEKQESSHRCAAEIIAGIIRGTKHWPYKKVENLWEYLVPLIRKALNNMTEETIFDWGISFATSSKHTDPNRNHWLLEVLMEDPLRNESSLIGCGRMYALQGALNQQGWRVSELNKRLLEYLRPQIAHPFQNVRDRLGSLLSTIFETDLRTVDGCCRTRSPKIEEFIKSILPRLNVLYTISSEDGELVTVEPMETDCIEASDSGIITKQVAIRLLKTMMQFLYCSLSRAKYGGLPVIFDFFPIVCLMENYEKDDELKRMCPVFLGVLSQSLTSYEKIGHAISSIRRVTNFNSWTAKRACLGFLQVFVFHNMAIFNSNPVWVSQVSEIVLRLLADERPEVREKASQVLSGLIHCDFIPVDVQEKLLKDFSKQCETKVNKHRQKDKTNVTNDLVKRHAGILGLCAFINASPYDVPESVPPIFLRLGMHLNDPQPIPSTIRKTLGDFKRTHHDNWAQHQLKFTEEQLSVLSDLIVPPSYYA